MAMRNKKVRDRKAHDILIVKDDAITPGWSLGLFPHPYVILLG